MSSFGIGRGLKEGVDMATRAFFSAAELKQKEEQAEKQRKFELDYLAARQGWQAGFEEAADPAKSTTLSASSPAEPAQQQVGRLRVPGLRPSPYRRPVATTPLTPGQALSVAPYFRQRLRY